MKTTPNFKAAVGDLEISNGRRIIGVELPSAHAGLTTALRRAFVAVPVGKVEQDLKRLLGLLG